MYLKILFEVKCFFDKILLILLCKIFKKGFTHGKVHFKKAAAFHCDLADYYERRVRPAALDADRGLL